ncbi:MAG: ABC transporter substrate-binding protein [Tissierellia bacterium]|nr:ABC transporter substrate-binding protein [Tissierellia bacterium]
MKRFISFLLVLVLIVGLFSNISYATNIDKKNFNTITTDSITKVDVDNLLSFGFTVKATGDKVEIAKKDVKFEFNKNSNEVSVNGVQFKTVGKTEVKNNKVYIPFRFFFETMNYEVVWNNGKTSVKKLNEPKYPVDYTNDGKKYLVSKEPSKIVSLAPDVTETIFRLGAGNKIIGRTKYCDYPAEAKKVKEVGTMYEPNIETVVSLKPDLIIAATHYKEDVIKKFQAAKIPTLVKDSPNRVEEAYKDILVIGNIVNKNYEARALASTMREKVNYVSMLTKSKFKPSVYFVVGTGDGGEFTHGDNTFVNDIIITAGGVNSAKDAEGYKYNVEKLIKNNPDYIFGGSWAKDIMTKSSNYSSLKAIKNNKFIVIDENVYNRPSERLVTDGLKAILKTIHPELMYKINF